MPDIDEIVEINASISAGAGPGADFGRVMLVTTDTRITVENRTQEFDDIGAVADAFPSGNILEQARTYFRQVPTPPPLKVGRWYKVPQVSKLTGGVHGALAVIPFHTAMH